MKEFTRAKKGLREFLKKQFYEPPPTGVRPLPVGGIPNASSLEILLVDVSASMTERDYKPSRIQAAKDACNQFIAKLRAVESQSAISVVTFGCAANEELLLCPVKSMSMDRISNRIHAIQANGMATNTFSGLQKVRRLFEASGIQARKCRVILLTDGHTTMGPNPRRLAFEIKDMGIQLDVIGIGGAPRDVAESDLRDLASVVDGQVRYWFIDSAPDLIRKFENLALRRID